MIIRIIIKKLLLTTLELVHLVGRLKIILKSSFLTSSGIGIEENVTILIRQFASIGSLEVPYSYLVSREVDIRFEFWPLSLQILASPTSTVSKNEARSFVRDSTLDA